MSDSFHHAYLKILTDSLSHTPPTQPPSSSTPTQSPPPSYTASTAPTYSPSTLYDSDTDSEPDTPSPVTIKINASTKFVGHGNYISAPASIDSARLVAEILTALRQQGEGARKERPVEISLDCGVSVAGCRNVVGGKGVGVGGVGKGEQGVKRKAEEELVGEAKRERDETEVVKG